MNVWASIAIACALLTTAPVQAGVVDRIFHNGFDLPGDLPASRADASRFLAQATFGGTPAQVEALMSGGYQAWFDAQRVQPPGFVLPYMRQAAGSADPLRPLPFHLYRQAWFVRVLSAPDDLRQRVAFALSEIFVVSERGAGLGNDGLALGAYHDILLRNALGSYRQLLEDVTLSPAMGRYLSMYRNRKPDPANNIQADENFAREVMQLFSIGLIQLHPDGSPVLVAGRTVPTYDVGVVRAMARVFTGWACHCATGQNCPPDPFVQENFTCSTEHAMVPYEAYHDRDEKRLFDGIVLPAGRDARSELAAALDALAGHPNVGPFIARQLIQRLVTSNPSAAYVGRVAAVFADDGRGARGNLAAVVRAILLDSEARQGHRVAPQTFGKVREPLLRLTQMWRAFDVMWEADELMLDDLDIHLRYNQSPLFSPSVFNFFSPGYAPPGALANAGLVAPEMQIITANYAIAVTNDIGGRIFWAYRGGPMDKFDDRARLIQLDRWERSIAPLPGTGQAPGGALEQLVERFDELLLGGTMSAPLRNRILTRLRAIPAGDTLKRVQNAIYLIATAPEYAVQR